MCVGVSVWLVWSDIRVAGILFHFLCAQHVSDINISIIRSLRLFCWITTLVVFFLVQCVLEFWCVWDGVVSVLQAFYLTSSVLNMFRTLIYLSSGACDYSVELSHWSYCSWFDVGWSFGVVGLEWYPCCRLQPATGIPLFPATSFLFLLKPTRVGQMETTTVSWSPILRFSILLWLCNV